MPNYRYEALTAQKKIISGTVDLPDRSAVIAALTKQGLRPIRISGGSAGAAHKSHSTLLAKKIKSDDIVMFTRQLSAMVGAGVPLLRALTSLSSHAENPSFKAIIDKVILQVEAGAPLADALEQHPNVFSDVYVNMVRAGEAAGILDDILKRLALQQEKNASIRKKVKGAMTYPVVLMGITVLAFFGLMIFVIPMIGKTIKDLAGPEAKLPLLTEIMLAISGFLISYWYIIFPLIVFGIFSLLRYIKTPTGKKLFHHFILKVPGIKTIITKLAVARFARTFSALMGAGVAVLEALSVTGRAIGNGVYEDALKVAAEDVTNGEPLSKSIERRPDLFPAIVAQMLAVGEETGQTDKVLVKVADFYEEEVDTAIDSVSSIIEPMMIVVMGGMVGLIAASVMGPISGLANQIQ